MGGMHTWLWGEKYPDFMDALVPMAAQPTAMSSRNWMMRRLIIDSIRNDPDWKDGNYTTQPRSVKSGGRVLWHRHLGRHAGLREGWRRRAQPPTSSWTSGWPRPSPPTPTTFSTVGVVGRLRRRTRPRRITAKLLAINAADDERNPPETGLMEGALKQVKNGRLYLIPASEETRGHGTTGKAKFYTKPLAELLGGAIR